MAGVHGTARGRARLGRALRRATKTNAARARASSPTASEHGRRRARTARGRRLGMSGGGGRGECRWRRMRGEIASAGRWLRGEIASAARWLRGKIASAARWLRGKIASAGFKTLLVVKYNYKLYKSRERMIKPCGSLRALRAGSSSARGSCRSSGCASSRRRR
jgi:hypothetical protein